MFDGSGVFQVDTEYILAKRRERFVKNLMLQLPFGDCKEKKRFPAFC